MGLFTIAFPISTCKSNLYDFGLPLCLCSRGSLCGCVWKNQMLIALVIGNSLNHGILGYRLFRQTHVSLVPSLSGHLMEAPAPFAPLAAEAPALPRPSERCQRCGSLFPSDANFCARCGLARSTDGQSYQHPEKLPGFADVFHFPDNQKNRKIVMQQIILNC